MTQEDKLEKAIELYKTANEDQKYVLEKLFPELKESEDEKIRKSLINYFRCIAKNGDTVWTNLDYDKVIAWLEKQKAIDALDEEERKFADDVDSYRKDMDEFYKKGYNAGREAEKQQNTLIWKHWKNGIAGNGEGKPIYLTKDGYTYRLSSLLSFECDYIELSELDKLLSEKQGEQKPVDEAEPKFHIGDKIRFFRKGTTNEEPMTITKIDEKGYWSDDLFICNFIDADRRLKLVERKSADKVESKQEPKFKTGTYVVYLNDTYMLEDDGKHYILTAIKKNTSTPVVHIPYGDEDYTMKEWTIQDAKDGDILMANAPFIFNGNLEGGSPGAHCGINTLGEFQIPEYPKHWTGHTTTPATKEQRELLFQKMKEAGYEWNAEKKELMKNIEQKPAWSEEDEYTIERLLCLLDNEQDKYPQLSCYFQEIEGIKDWLKSLKPQNTWKPSDEQMNLLEELMEDNNQRYFYTILKSLYQDLKKLREE